MKVKVELEDITWECGDCGNTYDITIHNCPNKFVHLARGQK
jgi:hypothetical protein